MLGSLAADTPHQLDLVPPAAATVSAGGCSASALPLEATCAALARRLFRAAAGAVGLPDELSYDGATMASELAANSLHAHENIQFDSVLGRAVAGAPEIWLYLRRVAGEQELVCKVYDSLAGWKDGRVPDPAGPVPADAVSGRGLHVIHALSGGPLGAPPDPRPARWLEGPGQGGLVRAARAVRLCAGALPAAPAGLVPGGQCPGADAP